MIIFRFQVNCGNGWCTEWLETKAEGLERIQRSKKNKWEAYLDEMTVQGAKETMVAQLNSADVHRMNWPGVEIARAP